jgi:hypothetical protein
VRKFIQDATFILSSLFGEKCDKKNCRLFLFLRMFPLSNPWETLLRKQTLENDAGIGSGLPAFENFQLKL